MAIDRRLARRSRAVVPVEGCAPPGYTCAMNDFARAAIEIPRAPRARRAALLLAVLMVGSWVTTTSQAWIGSLPSHGHLMLGVAHGKGTTTRHIHHGDELDRAQAALRPVGPSTSPDRPQPLAAQPGDTGGRRVLSLAPASGAQPEINTWSFSGALATVRGAPDADPGTALSTVDGRWWESRAIAPPEPPPRNSPRRAAAP